MFTVLFSSSKNKVSKGLCRREVTYDSYIHTPHIPEDFSCKFQRDGAICDKIIDEFHKGQKPGLELSPVVARKKLNRIIDKYSA